MFRADGGVQKAQSGQVQVTHLAGKVALNDSRPGSAKKYCDVINGKG